MVLGRIVTILPLLLFIGLFMGKRSIGEIPVFDFLVVLVLGSVVGADIADPKIHHFHTIVAIIAIALLQKLIVYVKMKNRAIGKLITFEPTIVIYNGQFLTENMRKVKYSFDNVLQMLREKDVFHVRDVEMAIIEANGNLSVRLVPHKNSVKREDMNITPTPHSYDIPVILDGEIQLDMLKRMNKDTDWLRQKLADQHIASVERVFFGSLTQSGELYISLKNEYPVDVPPIEH